MYDYSRDHRITKEHIAALPQHVRCLPGMAKPYLSNLCSEHELSPCGTAGSG